MTKSFVLSDETLNSYGFRILTSGIVLDQFIKNPVMLFNHQSAGENYSGPIGMWQNIRVEGDQLFADPVFDENDEFAQTIQRKVENGFIKGASIGFNIIATSEDPAMMLPGQTRPTVTQCIIYEVSIVDLPSNTNALALYDDNRNRIELKDGNQENLNQLLPPVKQDNYAGNIKLTRQTAAQLNLQPNATALQIEHAVSQLIHERETYRAKWAELENAAQTQLTERAVKLVDDAIAARKITAAERKDYITNAVANYKFVEHALSKMGTVQLPTKHIRPHGNADATKQNITLTDYRQNDPQALALMQLNDPEKFKALMDAFEATGK